MNSTEGLQRIAKVIRYLGYGIGALYVVIGIWELFDSTYGNSGGFKNMGVAWGIGGVCAALGWVIAWVLEGFAKPKDASDSRG